MTPLDRLAASIRRAPMLRDRTNAIATALMGVTLAYAGIRLVEWAVVNAIWWLPPEGGSQACRAVRGDGACWAVVADRFRFMLFGAYPFGEQWRPAVSCLLFATLYSASTVRTWWNWRLLGLWIALTAAAVALLRGGLFGLSDVPSEFWGGLPLTFILSTVGFAVAFPLAVALALGRRSDLPAIKGLCIAYIELVRGVPIVTFLFMAAVMFPLFVPQGLALDKLLRAQVALVLVIAAYVAEVIRGGLQAIPKGQYEAAASIGLSYWPSMMLIVLPQALRVSIPALVNTFIASFKDTSLVIVIGLFDLLGAAKAVIVDAKWVGFGVEVYLFVATVYFAFCSGVSQYSQRLERTLMPGSRPRPTGDAF
jgi:general L-amino acid transport system permease protein